VNQDPTSPILRAQGSLHQVVHSPEQHRLELPLAGPTSRILAYAIDYVAIVVLELLAFIALATVLPLTTYLRSLVGEIREAVQSGDPNAVAESSAILVIFSFLVILQLVIEWGYFIFSELTTGGRSLGKAAVGLRVVGDGGHPLRFGQSVARNLLRAVDILPGYYAVGLVAMIASDEGKRLGDLAAGTAVIRLDRPAAAPSVGSEPTPGSEAFRFSHQQIQRLGRPEQRLVRQTLRRLPELSPQQAEVALERTAEVIVERIAYEPVEASAREDFLRALLHTVDRR
jgi:uncharacterized RDD family membrane protein YckC